MVGQFYTNRCAGMTSFGSDVVNLHEDDRRVQQLERYAEATCILLKEQFNLIRSLREENMRLRTSTGAASSDIPSDHSTEYTSTITAMERMIDTLQHENSAKDAQILELTRIANELRQKRTVTCETTDGDRVSDLEQKLAYTTAELEKETAKVNELTKKDKALVEDHKRTWMELRHFKEAFTQKSSEVLTLQTQLEHAQARISELENELTSK